MNVLERIANGWAGLWTWPTFLPSNCEQNAGKPLPTPSREIVRRDWSGDISQILGRLDAYMDAVGPLKRAHADLYYWSFRVGADVLYGSRKYLSETELPDGFFEHLPAFGAVFWGGGEDDKLIRPCFGAFRRLSRREGNPVGRLHSCLARYEVVTTYYSAEHRKHLVVDAELLIHQDKSIQPLRNKNKWNRWEYPTIHVGSFNDPAEKIKGVLCLTASAALKRLGGFSVRAKQKGNAAAFWINNADGPRFFRDREITVLTPTGQRKRIFHHVAAHERKSRDGRISQVRAHYRGERRFQWNGYSVTISVPDHHYPDLRRWSAEGVDGAPRPGYMGMDEVAETLQQVLER